MLDEKFQLRIMPMQKQHIFKCIIAGIHAKQQRLFRQLLSCCDGFGKKFRRARLAVLLAFTKFCITEISLGSDIGEDRRIAIKILVGA